MLRIKAGVIGAACVVFGAGMLVSDAKHDLTGIHAAAVLVGRAEECKAEFQPKGESRRKEAMDCKIAEAFRSVVGEDKVRVHKTFLVVLSLPTGNGAQTTVKVQEGAVHSHFAAVGDSIQVVFNPAKPDDVRLPLTFAQVQGYLGIMGLGLLCLAIAFIGPILRLLSGVVAGKPDAPAKAEVAAEAPAELTRGQLALQQVAAAQQLRAGGAPQQFGRRAEARIAAAVTGPRRQAGGRG